MVDFIACLILDISHKLLEDVQNFSMMLHEEDKTITAMIVVENNKKSVSTNLVELHWTSYIGVSGPMHFGFFAHFQSPSLTGKDDR